MVMTNKLLDLQLQVPQIDFLNNELWELSKYISQCTKTLSNSTTVKICIKDAYQAKYICTNEVIILHCLRSYSALNVARRFFLSMSTCWRGVFQCFNSKQLFWFLFRCWYLFCKDFIVHHLIYLIVNSSICWKRKNIVNRKTNSNV